MPFNPDEPRDTHGRWTDGGAGASTSDDPRVTDVGGDKWNQETASRLDVPAKLRDAGGRAQPGSSKDDRA